jgi:hypothetical protein
MPKRIRTDSPSTPEEKLLEALERQVIQGQRALASRNNLVAKLHNNGGWTKASLFHRLNHARATMGAEPLTRSAIDVTVRRNPPANNP